MSIRYKDQIVANVSSSSSETPGENLYSTDETRIGTWINGKPIYRKIIVGDTSVTNIGYISDDIDTILFLDGIVNSQHGFSMPINGSGGTWYITTQVNMETGYIEFTTNQSTYKNQYIHVCVEYTKKKDRPSTGWWSPNLISDTEPFPFRAFASSNGASYGSTGIFAAYDNSTTTFWGNKNDKPCWTMFDFGSNTKCKGLRFLPRNGIPEQMPKTGYIEGSHDQVNWVKLTEWSDLPSPANGLFREHLFGAVVDYRYYRSTFDGSNYPSGNQHVTLSEIEFLLADIPSTPTVFIEKLSTTDITNIMEEKNNG